MVQIKINLANGIPCEGCRTKCSDCSSEVMPNKLMLERRLKSQTGIIEILHQPKIKKEELLLKIEETSQKEVASIVKQMGFKIIEQV